MISLGCSLLCDQPCCPLICNTDFTKPCAFFIFTNKHLSSLVFTLTSITHFFSPSLALSTQSCPHFFKTCFHSNCGNQSNRHPHPPGQTRVYLPPRASPRLARSPQTGSTTLGPSIPVVPTPTPPCTPSSFRPCSPVPSIISAPRPPSRPHKGCEPKEKKRRNKKKARIIQPLPCRTVLAQVPSFVPGPASPRLACPANTPSSRREQQPAGLGDGTGVWCYLKRYSLAPRMAPWSPADSAC